MLRLKELYQKEIVPKIKEKFNLKNSLAVPKIEKISVNFGIGEIRENPKLLETYIQDITLITGQKPQVTTAKKAISGFKVRKGEKVGLRVTLRGQRMYDFLEKIIRIDMPRVRDFRGLKDTGFDGKGNFNIGIKEHIMFPEIKYDQAEKIHGLNIAIKTNTLDDKISKELLTLLGLPFQNLKKKEKNG